MNQASRIFNLAASLALTTLCASTFAQTPVTFKSTCQNVGSSPQEPIGDRDGHAISVSQFSCRYEGGFVDGAIGTGMGVWEWDKGNAVSLVGNGVMRKAGAMAVWQISEGKNSLMMADGKVTGVSGSVKGVYKMATGSMASLAGKAVTATFRSIGGGQFVIETTVD